MTRFSSVYCRKILTTAFAAVLALLSAARSRGVFAAGVTVGETMKLTGSVRSESLGRNTVFDYGPGGNPALFDAAQSVHFKYRAAPIGVSVFDLGGKYLHERKCFGAQILSQSAGTVDIARFEQEIYTRNLQNDILASGSFGYAFSQYLTAGAGVKYLSSRLLDEYTLTASAFDAGVLWKPSALALSALAKNWGGETGYSGGAKTAPLPAVYSFGAGYFAGPAGVLASADYSAAEGKMSYSSGIEWRFTDEKVYPLNTAALRGGLRLSPGSPAPSAFSVGFSIGFSGALIEYAFVPLDDAGITHHVGLAYRFAHKTQVPKSMIAETAKILFVDGKFEEDSFAKLEDIAQTLKENPRYSVKIEGQLDLVDTVVDYFVRSERLPDSMFFPTEKDLQWVEVTLIKK